MRVFAKIQEEDAERANKDGFTKHKPHIGNIFSQIYTEFSADSRRISAPSNCDS